MTDTDSSPVASDSDTRPVNVSELPLMKRIRFWKRAMWVSVGGIILPPAAGGAMTAYQLVQTFKAMSSKGTGDPAALAEGVAEAQKWVQFGLMISLVFLVLFVVSWVRLRVARVEWEDQLVNGHKKAGAVRLQLL